MKGTTSNEPTIFRCFGRMKSCFHTIHIRMARLPCNVDLYEDEDTPFQYNDGLFFSLTFCSIDIPMLSYVCK